MLRVDRSLLSASEVVALDDARDVSARRRERNAEEHRCINETKARTHGFATHGRCCLRCRLVHRHGALVAYSMPEYKAAKPVLELVEVAS